MGGLEESFFFSHFLFYLTEVRTNCWSFLQVFHTSSFIIQFLFGLLKVTFFAINQEPNPILEEALVKFNLSNFRKHLLLHCQHVAHFHQAQFQLFKVQNKKARHFDTTHLGHMIYRPATLNSSQKIIFLKLYQSF